MTPKLLQKKSNRFLQLALPENLIANKRIGKREKYHHRPGAAANNLRGMEKRILGQWAFSWNMNKKRMEKQRTEISTARPEKMGPLGPAQPVAGFTPLHQRCIPLPFPRARLTTLPQVSRSARNPCFLVAPSLYILQDRISRALGGNVIQYLKKSLPVIPCPTGKAKAMPLLMPQAKAKENRPFRFLAEETRLEYSGTTHPLNRCAQQVELNDAEHGASTLRYFGKRGGVHSTWADPQPPANLISDAPVHFGHQRGEMLIEHCRKNHFNMIYSLLAAQILQNKARGDRRDRIADHYRNQLAEWRKIAFLYGGLGLKVALRLHRQAHLLGGDVDSNFLSLLECRLDVTLKRAFFFSTLKAARQWIQRGKIYVNNQRCTLAGTLLQPADLITISPGATMEWRKSRLQTFSLMTEKAAGTHVKWAPPTQWPTLKWNRNQISHRGGLPLANDWPPGASDRYQGAGWGARHLIAFPASLHRRFPFSPALMRKWKEWSQIWSNSRYSFLERHNWRANPTGEQHFQVLRSAGPLNDRFTGKGSQRAVSSTQSLYSSSALTHYLSATNSSLNNGQCAAKLLTNPQINLKENRAKLFPKEAENQPGVALPEAQAALDFSLLQRRQTYITSFICGLPMSMPDPKARGGRSTPTSPDNHNRLHQVGPGKLPGQGVRRDKSGRPAPLQSTTRGTNVMSTLLRAPLRRCATRLGQVIGGERKNRCQWLHQRQSNVVDGLYALRWNKGFARKKSQGEKKNQWRWSCIKPLHLECSYKLGTVIFLFFPQKLAWPASINVSLLRKKLGG